MPAPIFPPPIQTGDPIAVLAPASPPNSEALSLGIRLLEKRYKVVVSKNANAQNGYLAGNDEARAADFQRALDDDNIRAVIAARGGFGTSRIIDRLDFQQLSQSPKWIVGSSDLTALSAHLFAAFGLATVHGPMAAGFHQTDETDVEALFDLLEGKTQNSQHDLTSVFFGRAEGPMIGGNLTVLAHMAGTLPAGFAKGAVVFLEDVGEKPYRLDRCMTQLRRSGMLDNIAGIVFGDFTDCAPNADGVTARDVMKEFAHQAKIPAAFGYPAAHGKRNAPFVHGTPAVLEVTDKKAHLNLCK